MISSVCACAYMHVCVCGSVCVCARVPSRKLASLTPTGSCTSRSWGLACSSEHQRPGERVTPTCAIDFPGHFSPHNSSNDLGIKLLLGINNWLGLMALTVSWAIFPASH